MDSERRKHLESQLSAYLDGELTPQDRTDVDAFLAEDAGARALLGELRATAEAVRSLPRARASEELIDGLRERLERRALLADDRSAKSELPAPTLFRGRWIAAAAVIALTCAAGYMIWTLAAHEPAGEPAGPRYALREPESGARPAPSFDASHAEREMEEVAEGNGIMARAGDGDAVGRPPREAGAMPSRDEGHALDGVSSAGAYDRARRGGVAGLRSKDGPAARGTALGQFAWTEVRDGALKLAEVSTSVERYADVLADYLDEMKTAAAVTIASGHSERPEIGTVLELHFPDNASQQRAVATLCRRFAFKQDAALGLRGRYLAEAPGRAVAYDYSVLPEDAVPEGAPRDSSLSYEPTPEAARSKRRLADNEKGKTVPEFAGTRAVEGRAEYGGAMSAAVDVKSSAAKETALDAGGEMLARPAAVTELTLDVPDQETLTRIVSQLRSEIDVVAGQAVFEAEANGRAGTVKYMSPTPAGRIPAKKDIPAAPASPSARAEPQRPQTVLEPEDAIRGGGTSEFGRSGAQTRSVPADEPSVVDQTTPVAAEPAPATQPASETPVTLTIAKVIAATQPTVKVHWGLKDEADADRMACRAPVQMPATQPAHWSWTLGGDGGIVTAGGVQNVVRLYFRLPAAATRPAGRAPTASTIIAPDPPPARTEP